MFNAIARRQFLQRGLAGVSVAGAWPLFLGKTTAAVTAQGNPADDRVLVVVQLTGGNDGLSTVVPYSDPAYAAARQTTRVGEDSVLKIDERVGLHPNLKELKKLYDEGELAIVQGVSYPNPTRSHFEAMDIWHAGDLNGARRGSGWLGRALDATVREPDPTTAICVGGAVPPALVGKRIKPVAFQNPDRYRWQGRSSQREAFQTLNSQMKMERDAAVGELDYLLRVAQGADQSSSVIRDAVKGYRPKVSYASGGNQANLGNQGSQLAGGLQSIAAMIAGGLPTRVYYASLGGFDTHANQRPTHDNLMTSFSSALGSFVNDLREQQLLDRVVVLCFTEFGRRVKENGSRGTDHGVAGPMFVLGSHVRGGLHGDHPSLIKLDKGDLVMSLDFRQVYATILHGWLGAAPATVLGSPFEELPLLKARA